MKRFIKSAILAGVLTLAGTMANAQSLKDILNSSTVKDVVSAVTGVDLNQIVKTDITGTWAYDGFAVKLDSQNLLKSAAASVAASQVSKKANDIFEKIGIKPGAMDFTFNSDNTFAVTFKGKSFKGNYTLEGDALAMNFGKQLQLFKINGTVVVNGSDLQILFPADKLLSLMGKISANSSNATLSTIGTLASQYDGMRMGLDLKK